MIEFNNNIRIDFIVVSVIIVICRLLAESAGHFCQLETLENVANPDFDNFKHLQNFGHLLLTAPSMYSQYTGE